MVAVKPLLGDVFPKKLDKIEITRILDKIDRGDLASLFDVLEKRELMSHRLNNSAYNV